MKDPDEVALEKSRKLDLIIGILSTLKSANPGFSIDIYTEGMLDKIPIGFYFDTKELTENKIQELSSVLPAICQSFIDALDKEGINCELDETIYISKINRNGESTIRVPRKPTSTDQITDIQDYLKEYETVPDSIEYNRIEYKVIVNLVD